MESIKVTTALKMEQEAADIIHGIHCHSNHADQCGYMYFSWDKPDPGETRRRYQAIAHRFIRKFQGPPEQALQTLRLLKRSIELT